MVHQEHPKAASTRIILAMLASLAGATLGGFLGLHIGWRIACGLLPLILIGFDVLPLAVRFTRFVWNEHKPVLALLTVTVMGVILSLLPTMRAREALQIAEKDAQGQRAALAQQIADTKKKIRDLVSANDESEALMTRYKATSESLIAAVGSNNASEMDKLADELRQRKEELEKSIASIDKQIDALSERIQRVLETQGPLAAVNERLRRLKTELEERKSQLQRRQSEPGTPDGNKSPGEPDSPDAFTRILAFLLSYGFSELLGLFNDEELKNEARKAQRAIEAGESPDLSKLREAFNNPLMQARLLILLAKVGKDSPKLRPDSEDASKQLEAAKQQYRNSLTGRVKSLDTALVKDPKLSLDEIKKHVLVGGKVEGKFYDETDKRKTLEMLELLHSSVFVEHHVALQAIGTDK